MNEHTRLFTPEEIAKAKAILANASAKHDDTRCVNCFGTDRQAHLDKVPWRCNSWVTERDIQAVLTKDTREGVHVAIR